MKMSNNPAKYEVLVNQYFRLILDISSIFLFFTFEITFDFNDVGNRSEEI